MFIINASREGHNNWWRYLITITLTLVGMALGSLPMGVAIAIGVKNTHPELKEQAITEIIIQTIQDMDFTGLTLDPNLLFVLLLFQFILGMAFFYIAIRTLHVKRFASLVSAHNRVNWKRILAAFGVWFILQALFEGYNYWQHPASYSMHFEPISFITLLFLAFFLLPIQTSLEELLMRGYLLQGIGLLAKNKWIPILVTSMLFAAMHLANPEVDAYGTYKMMSYYFLIGLFFAIITVMDDGLEIPLGFHAAHNFFGVTLVNYDHSALSTPALFTTSSLDINSLIFITTIQIVVVLAFAKKILKWGSWSKLWQPVHLTKNPDDSSTFA